MKKVRQYKDFSQNDATKQSHGGFSYSDSGRSAAAMEDFMAKEPKTKEQFLNRMLMSDFSGDIRDLAADRNVQIRRVSANVLDLHFLASDQHFQLVVRKPRSEEQIAKMNAKREAKQMGRKTPKRTQHKPAAEGQAKH